MQISKHIIISLLVALMLLCVVMSGCLSSNKQNDMAVAAIKEQSYFDDDYHLIFVYKEGETLKHYQTYKIQIGRAHV